MKNLFTECDLIIKELYKFDSSIAFLGSAINDERLGVFEKEIGFSLPLDFKYMIKKHNGIALTGTEVYGLDKKLKGASLDKVYRFEHSKNFNRMPNEFLPFSPDGRGNHYCLNLLELNEGLCPVVFWQSDFDYSNKKKVEECNDNFIDWIKEVMIEWTLEDYNYDGTDKS